MSSKYDKFQKKRARHSGSRGTSTSRKAQLYKADKSRCDVCRGTNGTHERTCPEY